MVELVRHNYTHKVTNASLYETLSMAQGLDWEYNIVSRPSKATGCHTNTVVFHYQSENNLSKFFNAPIWQELNKGHKYILI